MKKILALLLAVMLLVFVFAACNQSTTSTDTPAEVATEAPVAEEETPAEPEVVEEPEEVVAPAEPVELTISAAQSMQDVLPQIADAYAVVHPEVTIVWNFGGSGKLETQITEGAPSDIFISAAQKNMNNLADADYILTDSRFDLLENKVVLVVPAGATLGISSFEDAVELAGTFALGDPESVPAGQYAQEIYTYLGLWDTVVAKASLGEDVRTVLSWVESGDADVGVVYATDAATTTGVTVVANAPEGSHSPIVYPAAVLSQSENPEAAQAFLDFLKGSEATALLEASGFSPLA